MAHQFTRTMRRFHAVLSLGVTLFGSGAVAVVALFADSSPTKHFPWWSWAAGHAALLVGAIFIGYLIMSSGQESVGTHRSRTLDSVSIGEVEGEIESSAEEFARDSVIGKIGRTGRLRHHPKRRAF